MKRYLKPGFAALALIFFFNVFAATKINAQNILPEILKRMDAHQKALKSLKANVVMDKFNSQLNEHDVYEGISQYVAVTGRDARVRIDWNKPQQETLVAADGKYILYRPRLKQALTGSTKSAKGGGSAGGALAFMSMSKEQLRANYSVVYLGQETVSGGAQTGHLQLTPKTAQSYKMAELWVDANGMPLQAKIIENNGDATTVLLSNLQKNISIDGKQFKLTLPKDVVPTKT